MCILFLKKTLIVLFVMLFFACLNSKAFAADYSANTRDPVIYSAITLTKTMNDSVVKVLAGENSTHQTIFVQFANLSELSYEYMNADAVTVIGEDGRMKIYIDKSLANSPPEAIACLLEHETTHNDSISSIEEEVVAWTKEATAWSYFTQKKPALANLDETKYPLVDRLNYLSGLYKQSGRTSSAIRQEILSNGVYTNLALHSEGF